MHAQVQTLPPEFDVRGVRPTALASYGGRAEQARDAFARGVQEQPDEWVLHLYLGKACASVLQPAVTVAYVASIVVPPEYGCLYFVW